MRFDRDRSGLLVPTRIVREREGKPLCDAGIQLGMPIGAGVNPFALDLYLNMRSYWNLDDNDATTTFTDNCDGPSALFMDMTARQTAGTVNTSVVSTTLSAKGGLAASFFPNTTEGTTAYVPNATNFEFPDSDLSFGGWFNSVVPNTVGSAKWIMGNYGDLTDAQLEILVDSSDNNIKFAASTNGTASAATVDSNYTSISNFILLVGTLDRTNNQLVFRWRDVSMGALGSATAAFAGALNTTIGTTNFNINDGLQNDSTYMSGARAGEGQASCCFYLGMGATFTDNHFNYLFNATNGKSWAQIKADAGH